jgi:3-oxoacyl-[acyl-carrier-protein] synthase-3
MEGREVYKSAVKCMPDAVMEALRRSKTELSNVALVIPHQANLRIIEAIRERLKLSAEKIFVNVDKVGNTSAASVGIALDQASHEGRLKPGDPIVLVAFGAGLTVASAVIRW